MDISKQVGMQRVANLPNVLVPRQLTGKLIPGSRLRRRVVISGATCTCYRAAWCLARVWSMSERPAAFKIVSLLFATSDSPGRSLFLVA
jgi:hypothetical protein